jgi:hypothetical protein
VKVGDLVRNLNSESKMTGIVVGWHKDSELYENGGTHPRVLWADGRCSWAMRHRAEVINESG